MTSQNRSSDDRNEDMDKRVRQASPGEPESGVRAESGEGDRQRRAESTSNDDAPNPVRAKDDRDATERVERMQQEGKGMGGTSTQGRTDSADEGAIERAASGEDEASQ